jgi:hypothetical protein
VFLAAFCHAETLTYYRAQAIYWGMTPLGEEKYCNQPFNSALMDQTLFDLHLRTNSNIIIDDTAKNALDNIGVVGGLILNKDPAVLTAEDVFKSDIATIVETCENFSEAGIALKSTANFHFYDMHPPVQSDFLLASSINKKIVETRPKHKAIIISGICQRGFSTFDPSFYDDTGFDSFDKPYGDKSVTNRRYGIDPQNWCIASYNIQAPFIITRGNPEEDVSTQNFDKNGEFYTEESESFSIALRSDQGIEFKDIWPTEPNLGLVVANEALPHYRDQLVAGSLFGDALLGLDAA